MLRSSLQKNRRKINACICFVGVECGLQVWEFMTMAVYRK